MVSPSKVAAFHAQYDRHPDDRVRLFRTLVGLLEPGVVLYAGSYVDIAPSVWFDEVVYVDTDDRAARFFAEAEQVDDLVGAKRREFGAELRSPPRVSFHHGDYREPMPIADGSVDLLVSLYAGFVTEHCSRYLRVGGYLLANPSHGDVARAALDDRYELAAALISRDGDYSSRTEGLDEYLVPKRPEQATVEHITATGRGIAYTRSAFAYVFRRRS
ncbi:MAG: hypothetical protein AAGA99_08735 [Actinomycetota bacterium]